MNERRTEQPRTEQPRTEIIHGGTALRLWTGAAGDDAHVTITFQRTLRIPDDGRSYPLPPGLGSFPLRHVRDYADRVPAGWAEKGGVFLPMFQREAMWLAFSGAQHALKIGVGKVCAVSGERWREGLTRKPQDYVVTGAQPWLDGIASGKGTIRQFVAMPLGMGYTVEGQVTGEETEGGIQLQAYAPKPGRIAGWGERPRWEEGMALACAMPMAAPMCAPAPGRQRASGAMGLAAGGRMKQKIYPDPHGLETWDTSARARVFVHIVNSELWQEITGEAPPPSPVTARAYASAGLPWFSLYDEGAATLDPTDTLASVKSVKELDAQKSTLPLQDDEPVAVKHVKKLWRKLRGGAVVDDGEW
jgi:hypothetical protein